MSEQVPQQQHPLGYYPPPYGAPQPHETEEIDFIEILRLLKTNWKMLFVVTIISTLIATVTALVMPPVYRADVLLAPVTAEKGSSSLSALASQFGGLASLAGVSVPSASDIETSIATLKSREFLTRFIKRYKLKPYLFADKWDSEQAHWKDGAHSHLQPSAQSIGGNNQLGDQGGNLDPGEPTDWDSYKLFSKSVLFVKQDKKTSLVTVSVEWRDPVLAAQWGNALVVDINAELRQRAINDAEKSISYLKEQLNQTSIADLRSVLFTLIEEHTRNITLAKVNDQYAFRVIDPAVPPQEKVKPRRAQMVILGFMGGLMLAIILVFIRRAIATMQDKHAI